MPQRAPFVQGTVPSSRSSRNPETILKSSALLSPPKIACRFLMDLRMFLVPVGMQLKGPPCLDNRKIVARSTHKLQPDREILLGEPAMNRHGWKPADIADAAERFGKSQIGIEIQRQRRCCNWLRGGGDDIDRLR